MKKFIYPLCIIALLLGSTLVSTTSCSKDDDEAVPADTTGGSDNKPNTGVTLAKKYDLEKGIIVLKNYNTLAEGVTIDTVYFKEYGAIEAKYVYDELNQLKEIKMQIADGYLYIIYVRSMEGIKRETATARGTEYSPDFENWAQEYLTEYKVKNLADSIVAGKTCKMYSYEASSTTFVRVADYKNIAMFYEVSTTGSLVFTTTYECTELFENAIIPDAKFNLPPDITFTNF